MVKPYKTSEKALGVLKYHPKSKVHMLLISGTGQESTSEELQVFCSLAPDDIWHPMIWAGDQRWKWVNIAAKRDSFTRVVRKPKTLKYTTLNYLRLVRHTEIKHTEVYTVAVQRRWGMRKTRFAAMQELICVKLNVLGSYLKREPP